MYPRTEAVWELQEQLNKVNSQLQENATLADPPLVLLKPKKDS